MAPLSWCALLVGGALSVQVWPRASSLPPLHRLRMMAATGPAPGGDLSGGSDEARNAQLAALKKAFYASAATAARGVGEERLDPSNLPGAAADAARLGMYLDVPLCRWSFVILPHHQAQLNVWQPQYTLMFESLLATPPPHYYVHLLLPGGTDSLSDPDYDLVDGTQAPRAGTLMRIVFARREEDARLTLVVQANPQSPTPCLPPPRKMSHSSSPPILAVFLTAIPPPPPVLTN